MRQCKMYLCHILTIAVNHSSTVANDILTLKLLIIATVAHRDILQISALETFQIKVL